MTSPNAAAPARRHLPSLTTLAAVVLGAAVFWGPPILLRARLAPGERFHLAIALFAVLVPAAFFFVWRAWFDAPTRAERLARWVRLAIFGPYAGAVIVGIVTYFFGQEFDQWRFNKNTPAFSGVLLPLALLTVRPGLMMLQYSMFAAAPLLLVITLFIPKGAHRPLDE